MEVGVSLYWAASLQREHEWRDVHGYIKEEILISLAKKMSLGRR